MLKSISFAITGILLFFSKERNAGIHLAAAIAVVITGLLFHISGMEWIMLVIMIMSVMVTEMVNTSIESLCDLIQPGIHEQVRIIKDLAAGAVLLASIASVVVAAIIFLPKIIS